MNTQSFYTRQMLLQYGKQLVAARRLARYNQLMGQKPPADTETANARRRAMIERITREIVENLVFSGSVNPVVLEVKDKLSRDLGEDFIFRYPPGELDFQIFRNTDEGEVEVSLDEKKKIMRRLWEITLLVVDETML